MRSGRSPSGDARVLLATDTAAEGLNLHARCRLVVHAEVPSSIRVFEQRTGRLDRYGQPRRVHAIVMSSLTREDREAMERLRTHAQRDEQWMAGVGASRCRRSAVAARRLALDVAQERPTAGGPAARDRDVAAIRACTLPPRRWRRLASRLGLPIGATAVWTATLRIAGGPELSASRVPVARGGDSHRGPPSLTSAPWQGPLRGSDGTRRMAGASPRRVGKPTPRVQSRSTSRRHAMADLFADASRSSDIRPDRRRQSDLWVTLEGETMIGPAADAR